MEIWKDIEGYEGFYKVSDYGNVKRISGSNRCKKDRNLVLKTKKSGYKFVGLSINSKLKYFHVHRLVAYAFIENKENKPFVNHKDMNKGNNSSNNLEWMTSSENNIHARKNKVFKKTYRLGIYNKKSVQIGQYINNELVYIWDSITSAAKFYKVSSTAIGKSLIRKHLCIGFYFRVIKKADFLQSNFNNPNNPPICTVNKRKRDLTNAKQKRIDNLKKITNEVLIEIGLFCLKKHGRLIRKEYDIISKEMKGLTYIPTVKRFDSWNNFKKEVLNSVLASSNTKLL